jgi:hypothetical protein
MANPRLKAWAPLELWHLNIILSPLTANGLLAEPSHSQSD